MILNTYINYGGRFSRLCYLIPLMVHTLFIYLAYLIYFNIHLFNIYILLLGVLFINLEWPMVIVYEYIYLTNYNIQNNLLYNIAIFIFLEIVLFVGFYWLYINNIIHYPNNSPFNDSLNFNLLDSINSLTNTDICLYVILHNLLLLLYVTLILQLVHKYLQISNSYSSFNLLLFLNHNFDINLFILILVIFSIMIYNGDSFGYYSGNRFISISSLLFIYLSCSSFSFSIYNINLISYNLLYNSLLSVLLFTVIISYFIYLSNTIHSNYFNIIFLLVSLSSFSFFSYSLSLVLFIIILFSYSSNFIYNSFHNFISYSNPSYPLNNLTIYKS